MKLFPFHHSGFDCSKFEAEGTWKKRRKKLILREKKRGTAQRKCKPMHNVEIKVRMDCEGCERRVRHTVTSLKVTLYLVTVYRKANYDFNPHSTSSAGVKSVEMVRKQSHVLVRGYVDPNTVF
ncbi:heavy metal-associated isoprenylated plant protein 24-like [Lotus japonicus]|uniref:heavy metal-associated isoprenylated plant protein 24-like n=1 Tax=Lotus japonicus TaxID=34305 RepID=UPI00258B4E29|nr:heavy metal-associated isoprenylated plant protein 24-like [Lotus japonicus]